MGSPVGCRRFDLKAMNPVILGALEAGKCLVVEFHTQQGGENGHSPSGELVAQREQ